MNYWENIEWGKEVLFWFLFLFFNFSVFVFLVLTNFKSLNLVPLRSILRSDGVRSKLRACFLSFNPDFYRICIDLSIIIILYRFLQLDKGVVFASCYFGFIFIYNIYHYSFNRIYQVAPVIFNDFRLIINAIGIIWAESKIKFISSILSIMILMYGLVAGFKWTLEFSSALPVNTSFLAILSVFGLYISASFWKYGFYNQEHDNAFRILFMPLRVLSNLKSSFILRNKMKNLNFDMLEKQRKTTLDLAEKPNVYCIFIESYGGLLLKEEKIKGSYLELYNSFSSLLKKNNWFIKNNYSESVSPIGPSWLAYTSVLFGSKVSNNFEYEFLLNKEEIYKYDTLMKVFMKEGYKSYNLNPTKPKAGVMVPYDQMKNFYGINQWILKDDIVFNGKDYGFTESPPDQYVLNYALEEVINKNQDPFILFYLTKNSHSPFISPKVPVEDWRKLNDEKKELIGNQFLRRPDLNDYINSIKYQINFIGDFIEKQGKDNDVFLLIGDHQPHDLGNKGYGMETLVHMISKNEKFVEGFKEYGFQDDLDNMNEPVKHEAIYSLFIREIMRTYGKTGVKIPPYEPNGIQL